MKPQDVLSFLISIAVFYAVLWMSQSKQTRRRIQRNLRGKVRAIGVVLTIIALVASIYQITGGPPWPTDPIVFPEAPSNGPPFDNPFDVLNKSSVFDIKRLSIHCEIVTV